MAELDARETCGSQGGYEPPAVRSLGSVAELTKTTTVKLSVERSDEVLKTEVASVPGALERLRLL